MSGDPGEPRLNPSVFGGDVERRFGALEEELRRTRDDSLKKSDVKFYGAILGAVLVLLGPALLGMFQFQLFYLFNKLGDVGDVDAKIELEVREELLKLHGEPITEYGMSLEKFSEECGKRGLTYSPLERSCLDLINNKSYRGEVMIYPTEPFPVP